MACEAVELMAGRVWRTGSISGMPYLYSRRAPIEGSAHQALTTGVSEAAGIARTLPSGQVLTLPRHDPEGQQ